jgi:hypothetical protein
MFLKRCDLFVWELYTIFDEIVKTTYIRSRPVYRLKIIARTRSISDGFLAFICILIIILLVLSGLLITGFFF